LRPEIRNLGNEVAIGERTIGEERSHYLGRLKREESFGREEIGSKEESLQERGVTTGEKGS
jgi:hypothetical protein